MTSATFITDQNSVLTGFIIKDHTSDDEDLTGKTTCAAVSSAAYMAANTLTEIAGIPCDITERDGFMQLTVKAGSDSAQIILRGLKLHLEELCKQYPKHISVKTN